MALSVFCSRTQRIEVEWEILRFLDLPHKERELLESPTFSLGAATYELGNYPKGWGRKSNDVWMSQYLFKMKGPDEQKVSFSLALKTGSSIFGERKYEHTFTGNGRGQGTEHFFKRSSLSERINNASSGGSLTIVCMARMLCSLDETDRFMGFENLSESFEQLFLSGHQTDVKLKVREKEFAAHKLVLGARSPVFSAMFQHEMEESKSGVVEIPDLDPRHFKDFLLFVYTGKLDQVTALNAFSLFKAADKYDLKDLKSECSMRMASGLNVDIIFEVIRLAVTHEETKLLDTATEYFIKNCDEILITDKWKAFLSENAELANELLVKMAKRLKATFKT